MCRCSLSVVTQTTAGVTDKEKVENLKNHFNSGSFLESFEHLLDFSTFHIDWCDEQESKTCSSNVTDLENVRIFTNRFKEISHFQSSKQPSGQKCFVVLGFKMFLDGGQDYFLSNWKELSGLGNLLLFLSTKNYLVGQVMLLQNIEPVNLVRDMFNHMVLVEVFYSKDMLIYLLDYVQRTRDGRNTGHVSVYHEIEIEKNVNGNEKLGFSI